MMKTDRVRFFVNFITICFLMVQILIWITRIIGIESYTILSGSMEPVLQIGDIVLVDTKDQDIKSDDIIAFTAGNQVVIHRVVEADTQDEYVTKGDANDEVDFDPVQKEEIIGTAKTRLRRWKWIWIFFHSNLRFAAVIGLVFLNLLTEEFEKVDGGVLVGDS